MAGDAIAGAIRDGRTRHDVLGRPVVLDHIEVRRHDGDAQRSRLEHNLLARQAPWRPGDPWVRFKPLDRLRALP